MDAITQAAAAAGDTVQTAVQTAVKTVKATVPVIAPEGKVPTEEELRLFFQNRAKAPEFYTFDPKGNLIVKEALGKGSKTSSKLGTVDGIPTSIKQVYSIPPYRPITKEERDEMDSERVDKVREMEEAYDAAVSAMRETYANYIEGLEGSSKESVIEANKAVAVADQARHEAMYAVREVYKRADVSITKVLETETSDRDRTFGASQIYMLRRSTYPLEKLYVTAGEEIMPVAEPEVNLTGVQGGGGGSKSRKEDDAKFAQQLAKDLKIILFGQPNENEFGFLSTFYPIEFVVDGVKYFTIEQMLAAEKARLFLDDALRTRIMKTRAPRSMRTMAAALLMKPPSQTGGMRQIQPHEWDGSIRQDVLRKATLAKFRQHTELRDKLLATGGAILALADTREKRDGIGLALNDTQAANTTVWKGGNLYGKILMEVRSQLRQEDRSDNETLAGGAGTEAVHEETISATDYKEAIDKAREGAIMGHMKARRAVRF